MKVERIDHHHTSGNNDETLFQINNNKKNDENHIQGTRNKKEIKINDDSIFIHSHNYVNIKFLYNNDNTIEAGTIHNNRKGKNNNTKITVVTVDA